MDRQVNVMGAEDFKNTGMFFYCTNEDIQSHSKPEIIDWFGNAKKITLENKSEFSIMAIEPIISFSNKAAVLIKVDAADIPQGIYPKTAIIH